MELKKTTVLSALVGAAGILSEIMFHDIMTTSIAGIVLSVVLTVIVVASVYFTMDGIFCILKEEREIAQKRQEEYEQKMYRIANEQLQFQKATYKEVHSLRQAGGGVVSPAAPITGSGENLLDKGTLEQLVQAVNENTMTASKIVAKYVNKNTMDIKFAIEQLQQEIPSVAEAIAVNREMLQNVENANSEILQHVESANRELLQSVETAIKEMEEQLASIEAKSAEQNVVTQNPPLSAADIFHLEEAPVAASLGEEVESLEELSMTSELDLNPSVMDMTEEAEIPEALEIPETIIENLDESEISEPVIEEAEETDMPEPAVVEEQVTDIPESVMEEEQEQVIDIPEPVIEEAEELEVPEAVMEEPEMEMTAGGIPVHPKTALERLLESAQQEMKLREEADNEPMALEESEEGDDEPMALEESEEGDDEPMALEESEEDDDEPMALEEPEESDDEPMALEESEDSNDDPVAIEEADMPDITPEMFAKQFEEETPLQNLLDLDEAHAPDLFEQPEEALTEDNSEEILPDDIASLLASMKAEDMASEMAAEANETVPAEQKEETPVSAPVMDDPNKQMSPEDIEALLASMNQ